MSTIVTINGSDVIATSRTNINTNFANLNSDKIETSYLDTDTSLSANSDSKIATQKATKAYVDASVNPTGRSWNEYAVDSSGTDSYAITVSGISSYIAGQTFKFKAGTANTGACSLNVNGLGAKTIKKDVSVDLDTGDIILNQTVVVIYDGTNMQLVSKTPTSSSTLKFNGTTGEAINGSTTPVPVFISPAQTASSATASGTGSDGSLTGASDSRYALAFQFTGATARMINTVRVNLKKAGSPTGNVIVELRNDNANVPGTLIGTIGTMEASSLTTSYADYTFTSTTFYACPATVWVVVRPSAEPSLSNNIVVQYSSTGSQLSSKDQDNNNSWFAYDASCTANATISTVLTAGLLYMSDANDTTRDDFDGFIYENVALSGTTSVKNKGLVSGFSGLTLGAEYFVSDTIGQIATSGTGSIAVGKALSATEIVI